MSFFGRISFAPLLLRRCRPTTIDHSCPHASWRATFLSTSSLSAAKNNRKQNRGRAEGRMVMGGAAAVSAIFIIGVSIERRNYRRQHTLQDLQTIDDEVWRRHYPERDWASTIQLVERMGLMGKQKTGVTAELDQIRNWHVEHGFPGGLVLRDLTRQVFGLEWMMPTQQPYGTDNDNNGPPVEAPGWSWDEIVKDPTRLSRRECYYLYYELRGTGEVVQQLFCRGTTLWVDVLTCLQAWMVYDQDLDCRVHRGFRNQAQRILLDVLPLLSPPNHPRATVELCGHSLGGAVAAILASKLRKRGYRVVRLTTVGEPRFLLSDHDASQLALWQPKDCLRIEHENDVVTFLPPFGVHFLGDRVWLASTGSYTTTIADDQQRTATGRLVLAGSHPWTDSIWNNFRFWEILVAQGRPHRIPSYVEQLQAIM